MSDDWSVSPPVDPHVVIRAHIVDQVAKVVPYDISQPLIDQYTAAVVTPQSSILEEFSTLLK